MPLAVFPLNGLYREELCETLDSLGMRWRVSYASTSLAALTAGTARPVLVGTTAIERPR